MNAFTGRDEQQLEEAVRVQRVRLFVQVRTRVHDRPFDEVQHGPAGPHRLGSRLRTVLWPDLWHGLTIRAKVQIVLDRVHIGLVAGDCRSQDRGTGETSSPVHQPKIERFVRAPNESFHRPS